MQWGDWPPRAEALRPAYDLWRSGNLDRAQELFEAWTRLQPEDADGWRGLGNVFWSRGDFVRCLSCYQTALHLKPWSSMNWGNLGLVFRDLGQFQEAEAAFRVCLALDPTYAPGLNEWANVCYDDGRYHEALLLYGRSLAIDAGRAVVHHNRGVCLRTLGQTAAAIDSFQQALSLDPAYHWSIAELRGLAELTSRHC